MLELVAAVLSWRPHIGQKLIIAFRVDQMRNGSQRQDHGPGRPRLRLRSAGGSHRSPSVGPTQAADRLELYRATDSTPLNSFTRKQLNKLSSLPPSK